MTPGLGDEDRELVRACRASRLVWADWAALAGGVLAAGTGVWLCGVAEATRERWAAGVLCLAGGLLVSGFGREAAARALVARLAARAGGRQAEGHDTPA